ncbi:unnamed protein product [Thlaspi arvense]|uniref:AAA+ ATPase domain-containing protein n=1 Tax=Thlaspi arvense TaxID=13288 RepID=A0AAU9RK80_THLAR|nr:unnamed protein product [Thlaspi arvense]
MRKRKGRVFSVGSKESNTMVPGLWGFAGTAMASLMFFRSMYSQFVPCELQAYIEKFVYKMMGWVSIKFNEYTGEGLQRSKAYDSIRHYLSATSTAHTQRMKANESRNSKSLVLSMDDHEEVEEFFEGVKVKWYSSTYKVENRANAMPRRYYTLTFHRRHRRMIVERYMEHVLREGKAIGLRNRERKLYTNNSCDDWSYFTEGKWGNVPFNHPATFETLAMDPEKKEEIKKDLLRFSKAEDYYRKVGKAWKRGYLLFGPPGTGKSMMISAMANFLDYDVYDLELTTKEVRVTLSGLLNAIDGLWSSCSGEKIIVFTTNFVDKLDPALIRRGRMDKHIEMSYCKFEAFKVLAKNYLDIESHGLYGEIERMLEETDMSLADVAENLMPKSDEEDADVCLKRLVKSLEEEKERAKKLAEEEEEKKAKTKTEKEKKERAKKLADEEEKKKTEEAEDETLKPP